MDDYGISMGIGTFAKNYQFLHCSCLNDCNHRIVPIFRKLSDDLNVFKFTKNYSGVDCQHTPNHISNNDNLLHRSSSLGYLDTYDYRVAYIFHKFSGNTETFFSRITILKADPANIIFAGSFFLKKI